MRDAVANEGDDVAILKLGRDSYRIDSVAQQELDDRSGIVESMFVPDSGLVNYGDFAAESLVALGQDGGVARDRNHVVGVSHDVQQGHFGPRDRLEEVDL